MGDLFILFMSLTVFGVGVTAVDFIGVLDHFGNDGDGHGDGSSHEHGDESGHGDGSGHGHGSGHTHDAPADSHSVETANAANAANAANHGSNLAPENKNSKLTGDTGRPEDKTGIAVISKIINVLRNIVYFSLGFGPTGLFAIFSGLSRTSGLIWACAAGVVMMVLARLLKRFIRRDMDSSIKPDELLQERGVLLLPLEGGAISKAVVRQYGRDIEVYVRCKNKNVTLPKGKEIIIEDYDNDVYWIEPAADGGQ